ncbi:Ldh family oxidoreductase [Rhodococcus sp. G-MC3]|uniref:Ldh family oxidoreductase n=1 Tax=Rhodococcus sp. G-MC3 TaxID=3046209 RepID=UPI0024BB4BE2|nr:Ldh family oxidoreductase [Rhodococcus sp. G-MC3]MDJ0396575.1 Ldh family oxidoreductase [Rhodococcus sp. G-MC3]
MLLPISDARALVESAMVAAGQTREEAEIIADHLIDCELRGLSFGGLARALSVIERIRTAEEPHRPITVRRETLLSAALDGGDQVGYLVAKRVTDMAIEKARSNTGLAIVGASNTWYTGMFSYYLEMVTNAGFVGMIAGSGGPKVAPHGGTEARFSTNPIAFGFPADPQPVIWDVGTSSVMLGEVMLAERLGQALPEGRAFDPAGNPTLDPSDALAGAFTVWGGHKGSGLSMVVQLLGMLAGQAASPQGLTDCGFLLVVIDPELLLPREDYFRRVSDFADTVRGTRREDENASVRVPFDRSAAERSRRLDEGVIDVPQQIYDALAAVAAAPAN